MKTIKYLMLGFVLIFGISACELPDNVDPKNPSEVPPQTLFTNGMVALFNMVDDESVNRNVTRLHVQYWQETTYFDESRYLWLDRNIPDGWAEYFYRRSLQDLRTARMLYESGEVGGDPDEIENMINIIKIVEAFGWQYVVDAMGDMPYTEAFMGAENPQPVYDDAAEIYASEMEKLDEAIGALNTGAGSFGPADVLYNGDVAMWKKFGATTLMKYGMRLADVSPNISTEYVNKALDYGVFEAQSESGILQYTGVVPHVNSIYNHFTVNGRADYLPTNTFIDLLKDLADPRLPLYFTEYEGDYIGAIAGLDGAQSYQNYSHFQDIFHEPTFPAIMTDYVETLFLMAEAAQRGGYNTSMSAADYFNMAVTESILYWGGTQDDADAYLASHPYDAGAWKESIGTQKWIALYPRGVEGWTEWRRLDFPILNVPEGMVYDDIPKRYPYPFREPQQNRTNYDNAVDKMGPIGDDHRNRIFWDIN